jgi:hypothetical protein
LIEAWASLKSFKPKDGSVDNPADDAGNPTVNFHGERRSNATHESTTDPEARLARKDAGKEAKLCYSGNALMENRNGLLVDFQSAFLFCQRGVVSSETERRIGRTGTQTGREGYELEAVVYSMRTAAGDWNHRGCPGPNQLRSGQLCSNGVG